MGMKMKMGEEQGSDRESLSSSFWVKGEPNKSKPALVPSSGHRLLGVGVGLHVPYLAQDLCWLTSGVPSIRHGLESRSHHSTLCISYMNSSMSMACPRSIISDGSRLCSRREIKSVLTLDGGTLPTQIYSSSDGLFAH